MTSNTRKQSDNEPSNAELWALLQEQRAEIQGLKAELGRRMATEAGPPAARRRLSRAGLLKAALAGAAGIAGASALGSGGPSEALASGDTSFVAYGASPTGPNSSWGFYAVLNQFDEGVHAWGESVGVHGMGHSTSGSNGVLGEAYNGGVGVYGSVLSGGTGVRGDGDYGVWGHTGNKQGVGLVGEGGRAQLSLVPPTGGTGGPPAGTTCYLGDVFVDTAGIFYRCIQPGTIGASDFVPKMIPLYSVIPVGPIRVLDTRTGTGGYSGMKATGSTLTIRLFSGAIGANGSTTPVPIPDGTVGLIGTLRAYGPTGPGYLTAYPGYDSPPTASNVNFYPNGPSYAVADQITTGLDFDGFMSIYVGGPAGPSTHVVFDLAAYIA